MRNPPTFEPGEIVLAKFPFTDLTGTKVRPVVVLRDLAEVTGSDDVIICPISSRQSPDTDTVVRLIEGTVEFLTTNLKGTSEVHVAKLFTCDRRIIARRIGILAQETFERVRAVLRRILLD